MSFQGQTILITGASRGIGLAIALRYAAAKANIVVGTKDSSEAIESVESQILTAGGHPLMLNLDISNEIAIQKAVSQAVDQFGSVNILVNNTSATCLTDILHTAPEQFDLVMATSVRAAFFLSQACYPYLKESSNPHIIHISPPLTMDPYWFKDHLAFSLGKYAMSMCTLGMAERFKKDGIAVNSLWPKTTIATQTIKDHFLPKVHASSRWPSIMADAAFELALFNARQCTGNFFAVPVRTVGGSQKVASLLTARPFAGKISLSRDLSSYSRLISYVCLKFHFFTYMRCFGLNVPQTRH